MKKPKVIIPPHLLDSFPEEERADIEARIREAFEGTDMDNLPGRPIEEIAASVSNCPGCGGPLKFEHTATLNYPEGDETKDFFECPACDRIFGRPAAN